MAKAFLAQLFVLLFILPSLSYILVSSITTNYVERSYTRIGTIYDTIVSDVALFVPRNITIERSSPSTVAISVNASSPEKDNSKEVKDYRNYISGALSALGYNYSIDFSSLESKNDVFLYFSNGFSQVSSKNKYEMEFYGKSSLTGINASIFYTIPGVSSVGKRKLKVDRFYAGNVPVNIVITDDYGAPLYFNDSINPTKETRLKLTYNYGKKNKDKNEVRIVIGKISNKQKYSIQIIEKKKKQPGSGYANITMVASEPSYVLAYYPGGLNISQGNVYKEPVGIVVGEG
ncbi:MAG: hypothetical protein D6769_02250 [Methanobacteriota archaeon]|nr:MAG: hypothetical protein D6769_02250 [Euryarchaeota archaeon]